MKLARSCRICILSLCVVGTSACGSFGDAPDTEVIQSIIQRTVNNQVFVEGGGFELGDVGNGEGVPYVTLTPFSRPTVYVEIDSYSISKYETTWGELRIYLEDTGRVDRYEQDRSKEKFVRSTDDPMSPHYHHKPARSPNYHEAAGYCQWLAEKTGLPFALPTEAQWEYAARSRGKPVAYATNNGQEENDEYLQRPREYIDPGIPPSGNMLSHSASIMERRPVGTYPPNPLGLHDMTGNVAEWTQDWFQEDYYEHAPRDNPQGPADPVDPGNPRKTVRDWSGRGDHMGGGGTVYARAGRNVDLAGFGFRCVVNHPEPIN